MKQRSLVKSDANDLLYSSEAPPEARHENAADAEQSRVSVVFNVNSAETRSYAASGRGEEPAVEAADGIPEEDVGYDDSVQILVESDHSGMDSPRENEGLTLVKI